MRGPCQGLDRSSAADAVAMPRTGEIDCLRAKCVVRRSKKNQLKRLEPKCRELQNGVSFYPDDDRDDDDAGEEEMMMMRRRMVMVMMMMVMMMVVVVMMMMMVMTTNDGDDGDAGDDGDFLFYCHIVKSHSYQRGPLCTSGEIALSPVEVNLVDDVVETILASSGCTTVCRFRMQQQWCVDSACNNRARKHASTLPAVQSAKVPGEFHLVIDVSLSQTVN